MDEPNSEDYTEHVQQPEDELAPRSSHCYALQHGDRVLVYDAREFVNDWETPCSMLMRPATVVCRYGSV